MKAEIKFKGETANIMANQFYAKLAVLGTIKVVEGNNETALIIESTKPKLKILKRDMTGFTIKAMMKLAKIKMTFKLLKEE